MVQRALLSLPRHKHIKFISQTAILEFKSGVPDRGRSMFEGILGEYPKRTDLWSIYLDQVSCFSTVHLCYISSFCWGISYNLDSYLSGNSTWRCRFDSRTI